MQALSICPRRSTPMLFVCDFPPKRVEVKLRRLRNHHPARPSSSITNDSFSVSGQEVCRKRLEVKLHRCEVPTGSNLPLQPIDTHCFPLSHSSTLPPSSTSNSCPSRKPTKPKRNLAMVSYPAKTPRIEEMKKTKKGNDEDEEVVILWQG